MEKVRGIKGYNYARMIKSRIARRFSCSSLKDNVRIGHLHAKKISGSWVYIVSFDLINLPTDYLGDKVGSFNITPQVFLAHISAGLGKKALEEEVDYGARKIFLSVMPIIKEKLTECSGHANNAAA